MNTIAEYPIPEALGNLISEQAHQSPDRLAVKFKDSTLTYKNLNQQVNQLAALLISQNIKVGDRVGVALDRSDKMVICLLAIVKAGAAYVPLDPNFPADRLNFMLADSEANLLITSKQYAGLFETETGKLFIDDALAQSAAFGIDDPAVKVKGTDLVYILYTSGSTGLPKGVQISHQNLINLLYSLQTTPGVSHNDILLAVTTISFDMSVVELFLPLVSGALLIVADPEAVKDGRLLLDTLKKEKVTIMQATPYTWRMVVAGGWDEPLPVRVFCGGEPMTKKLAGSLLAVCPELWNMYGPTETTIYSIIKQVTTTAEDITIGKPVNSTQIYILNEQLKPVRPGEVGEICIGGAGLARGYYNRPELTDEKFIRYPDDGDSNYRIYRTGDLGKIVANGDVLCLGRIDHQVKIRGFRIETEEIEHNLSKLENVNEAVVVVHTDELDNQRLVAYVQLKDDTLKISQDEYTAVWTDALRGKLPDYMLPHFYVIIKELPLTPNGKIDRKALPKPVIEAHASVGDIIAPVTETERMLTALWAKYLAVKNISTADNFFDLGGHSMVAVQVMVEFEKLTGQRLPIALLFDHPTIQQLAAWVDDKDKTTAWKSLVKIKEGGKKTPLYLIHGEGLNLLVFNGLANHLDPEQPVYGLQSLGLNGFDEQLDTIEEIAAHYNSEILADNPSGPYAIVGYSLGGHIAIEMVKQLEAQGKEVKLLGMIDTNLKPSDGDTKAARIFSKIKRQFPKALFVIKSLFADPGATVAYQAKMISLKTRELFEKEKSFKGSYLEGIPDFMGKLVEKLRTAVANYKVTPYNGKIFLFRAKTRVYFVDDFKTLGWGKIAQKGVVVNDVPGDHKIMLLPPHDKQFAKILQRVLDEVAKGYLFLFFVNYLIDNLALA
ncbi:amino acid adenylation domain-containing protein [Mucilaginibacter sp. PPCGB 2223]|uniref:non-ribosomal peptide synthetase n=1 Tax=Mucilaginibacter sp. PPCGB 2223 TaxID=1886027 RepID=UPI000B32146C|nr:amino acid adenylation domain-containing protein [Mucilaginibacter sp. PPCGB 2223]